MNENYFTANLYNLHFALYRDYNFLKYAFHWNIPLLFVYSEAYKN